MEKDMRVEVRFYPILNNIKISFSLSEAVTAIGSERRSRLTEEQIGALEIYLNLLPIHVRHMYKRIQHWKEP